MAEIGFEQAHEIAGQMVAGIELEADDTMVLREELTQEKPYGWVFFYDAKRFVDTGDPRFIIRGNAPIIVDRRDGSAQFTGTAQPLHRYLEEYEKAHP